MEKVNDMLLATIANPQAKAFDFLNNNVLPENTQLLTRDEYKSKKSIQDQFVKDDKFDDEAFNNAYDIALYNYNRIADEKFIESIHQAEYSPFDVTRPLKSKIYSVDVQYGEDFNPMRNLYSRDGMNLITPGRFSQRELAQASDVFDPKTQTWLGKSANELGFFDKWFGDTLVYAAWDEDGIHVDPISGRTVNHKKGEWKINENGDFFIEKLAGREIYGKQIVNPTDILTTDGSVFNRFDFFDADGREKSIASTALRTVVEIAPFLIPKVNVVYAGMKAAVGLSAVMPTFFKSIESLLRGDETSALTDPASEIEGYMAKFVQRSTSDKASESFFNGEQILSMVSDIFSQIHEQRAMAGLSNLLYRPDKLMNRKAMELQMKATVEAKFLARQFGTSVEDVMPRILQGLPELQDMLKAQSRMSKALSLGYMALTSTGEIYGEALEGGYDRKTAGFASLLAASGTYTLMMNNRMGDWFLDKTTGYNVETSRALMSKSVKPWFKEIQEIFSAKGMTNAVRRNKLAEIATKAKGGMKNFFTGNSVIGEAMLKNALVEGVEEVTEELVLDATRGIVDVMSYLGLTKERGSFDTLKRFADGTAFQDYLANFVGGLLGGAMFEFERTKITPWIENKGVVTPLTIQNIYELVADGKKNELISEIKKQVKNLTNGSLSYIDENGNYLPASDNNISQQELISNKAVEIITWLDQVINSEGLGLSDEDIIVKAVRQKVIIDKLNEYKPEGKHTGIEALVLHDFKNTGLKIDRIKSKILELKKTEGNEKQIAIEQEKMLPLTQKRNSILSGEKSSEYFTKLLFGLSPNINKYFGTLDIDTYTKALHGKSYAELPDTDAAISKETVTEAWNEFIESADIYEKLSIMTDAYLETERNVDPVMKEYVESGYLEMRQEIYDTLLDMAQTLKNFDLSDDATKNQKIMNFIELNNSFENKGLKKVLPWDSLSLTFVNKLEDNNLIRNISYVKNDEGEWIQRVEDSPVNKELFVQNFNNVTKQFYPNYLQSEEVIHAYNESVNKHNINILQQIDSTNDPDRIAELESQLINAIVLDFEGSEKFNNFREEYDNRIKSLNSEYNITSELSEEYRKVVENRQLYESDTLPIVELNEETNQYDINSEKAKEIYRTLTENGLLALVTLSEQQSNLLESISLKIDTTEDLNEEEVNLITLLNNLVSEFQDRGKELLNDQNLKQYSDKIKGAENNFNERVARTRPDFLNVKNLAFDSIMSVLENGFNDNELFLAVKDIYEDNLGTLKRSLFKNESEISDDEFVSMLENRSDYDNILVSFASVMGDYSDISINEILDMFEATNNGIDINDHISNLENGESLLNFYYDSQDAGFNPSNENLKTVSKIVSADGLIDSSYDDASNILANKFSEPSFMNLDLSIARRFLDFVSNNNKLLNNPIYEFLRKFSVTLDPSNRTSTILDILEREEVNYKAASGVSNFISDNIRESDIETSINMLEMIRSIVYASTSTEITANDIVGFLGTRQDYARKTSSGLEVLDLQTLTSEEAQVLVNDINRIITKLDFLKELAKSNQTRAATEQAEIGNKMDSFRLNDWDYLVKNIGEEYIPAQVKEILNSSESNFNKLRKIEDAVYDQNQHQLEKAYSIFLSKLPNFNYTVRSDITLDTKEAEIADYDKSIYFATVLSTHSSDWWKQRAKALETSKKAPFPMQDYAARVILSRIKNPELFASLEKYKIDYADYKNTNKGSVAPEVRAMALYLTTVMGSAGSGKSTAVMGTVLNILKQSNPKTRVWLTAPQVRQRDNLTKAVISETGVEGFEYSSFDKDQLFKELGLEELHRQIKDELVDTSNSNNTLVKDINGLPTFIIPENIDIDASRLPNVIVVDEITHFSNPEILLLNEIAKRTKSVNIVTLGDPNQMGYQLKVKSGNDFRYLNFGLVGLNTVMTPTLKLSVRASNESVRFNNDLLVGLINKVVDIHSKAKNDTDAINEVSKYLSDLDTIKSLNYYIDDSDIKGSYIIDGYNVSDFKRVKRIIEDKGRNFIILTENGELNDDYVKVLQDVGLYQNGVLNENITVKDGNKLLEDIAANKIQGSEVDHIIFDVNLTTKYDKQRDVLRSFYTYNSRSRVGSMIIGAKLLENKIGIVNSEISKHPPIEYQPLTDSVIEDLKSQKINQLTTDLGDMNLLHPRFTWIDTEVVEEIATGTEAVVPGINNTSIDGDGSEKEESQLRKTISVDNFQIMVHSFYNNLGVENISEDGVLSEIRVNSNNPSTDLNGVKSVTDRKSVATLLTEWANLKNDLLFNTVNKNNYKSYFAHIFNEDFTESSSMLDNIDINFKITAQKYSTDVNNPYAKHGESTPLNNGDLFLNLSAEITYDGKSHFVTIASFSTLETFIKAIDTYGVKADIASLKTKAEQTFEEINKRLNDSISNGQKMLILNSFNLDQVTKLTNTRFDSKNRNIKHDLSDLSKNFPGMKTSEMRLFPGKKSEFVNLLSKYTFGTQRSNKTIDEIYNKYKNKPYVIVSFDSKLDGTTDNTSQARIVPINSKSRSFNEVVKEVRELREDLKASYSSDGKLNKDVRLEFNSRQQALLSTPQILYVLANWSKTTDADGKPLINLLTDKVGENSVIDILSRFKNSDNETTKKLLEVIDIVKKETKSDRTVNEIVYAVIPQLGFKTGWTWNFFNLFDYNDILREKSLDNKAELLKLNFSQEESDLNIGILDSLKTNVDTLFKELPKDYKWYYSIPIEKGERGNIVVNKHVRGDNGFDNSLFSDKFYISGTPESPRLIIPLASLLGTVTQVQPKTPVKVEPKIKPKVEPTVIPSTTDSLLKGIEGFTVMDINDKPVKPLEGFIQNVYSLPEIKPSLNDQVLTEAITLLNNPNLSPLSSVNAFLYHLVNNSSQVITDADSGLINSRSFVEFWFGRTKNKSLKNFIDNINNKLKQCK